MKKVLLNVGDVVEFVKGGAVDEGLLLVKDTYKAVIEFDGENAKELVDVPYKDIKAKI